MAISTIPSAGLGTPLSLSSATVTTLNAPSGVLATQNGMTGIAKAWVQFQGGNGNTAGTINGSFNVSSITVNGTGSYTVNFTTSMPNANYSTAVTSSSTGSGIRMTGINDTPTTGSITVYSAYASTTGGSSTLVNTATMNVSVFSS